MLRNDFHPESDIVLADIEILGNATWGLRFELCNLLEHCENKEVVFVRGAQPVADSYERDVTVIVGISGWDWDFEGMVRPASFPSRSTSPRSAIRTRFEGLLGRQIPSCGIGVGQD